MSAAGDVNGDTFDDVLVAAPGYPNGMGVGRVYLVFGTPNWTPGVPFSGQRYPDPMTSGSDFINTGSDPGGRGTGLGYAGDIDGDGLSDFVVGSPLYDGTHSDEGSVTVFFDPLDTAQDPGRSVTIRGGDIESLLQLPSGEANFAQFGSSVRGAGSVDGDEYPDIVIGAPGWNGGRGAAFVFSGADLIAAANGGTTPAPIQSYFETQAGAAYGSRVDTAGDVNGDGFADIIVTAESYDAGATNSGAVFVYHGMSGGISSQPQGGGVYFEAPSQNNGLADARTAGDLNGDGYADVVISSRNFSSSRGSVWIALGGLPVSEAFSRSARVRTVEITTPRSARLAISTGTDLGISSSERLVTPPWIGGGSTYFSDVVETLGHSQRLVPRS